MSLFADYTRFNGSTKSPPLSIPQSVNGYNYIGCYAESNGKAVSQNGLTDTSSMTVEECAQNCAAYQYFQLEFGQECTCGNSLNKAITLAPDSDCGMTCKGNNSEVGHMQDFACSPEEYTC